MKNIKNFLVKYWQFIVIIVLFFIVIKKCNNTDFLDGKKENLEVKEKENANNSMFYFDEYLKQTKRTSSYQKKADSLQSRINNIQLPKWYNRKKLITVLPITNVKDCNDTIAKIIEIAKVNESICDTIILKFKKENIQQDSIIISQSKEVLNLVKSDSFKTKQVINLKDIVKIEEKKVKKEKRKNIFLTILLGVVSIIAITK